ncbi:MAG TPA: hypothetical protein VHE78_01700 [Gemmatimonadaceae bacterium]|nr:hypothetical protein [Gemmatimonadaceae bacterium]
MRRLRPAMLTALNAALLLAPSARAQESLLPSTSWALAPIFTTWHFGTSIPQAGGSVKDVRQFALPVRAGMTLGDRWSVDLSGAASTSSVQVENAGAVRTLTLNGLTDVKLRVSGALVGDGLEVTAGLNIPTGATGLSADQTAVLQTIGAPALRMPVSALGLGPGATLGLVGARTAGAWALALGASVEKRTEYTPIELALAGGKSPTKVTPGSALHVTVGAERGIGDNRLSLLLVADGYSTDQVKIGLDGGATANSSYKLGPQLMALGRLDLAARGWRDANTALVVRYRSTFTDASGMAVPGSNAAYVEASLAGVRGGATGLGLILGADARYHTGLSFTDALVGAAVSAGGVTLGVEIPTGSAVLRLAARGQYGQFNTGTARSSAAGLTLMGAVGARGQAR